MEKSGVLTGVRILAGGRRMAIVALKGAIDDVRNGSP